MRIALSYHGGDHDYDAYPEALHRRARALGCEIETFWLAGAGRAAEPERLERADGLVLTGGADVEPRRYGVAYPGGLCRVQPERDAAEWEMLEAIARRPLPTLAICRGAQILNVFHGGTLLPDLGEKNTVHRRSEGERRSHDVAIAPGTRLHGIAGALGGPVNSSHHQAVDRLADGFRLAAWSPDGVIEAYEPEGGTAFLLAVQWHPEAMEAGQRLSDRVLDAFLRAASS